MAQQRFITSLGVVLAFACVANAGLAQTQATKTPHSHQEVRSSPPLHRPRRRLIPCHKLADAAAAEQQLDGDATRRQSHSGAENLVFQPLMKLRLTEKQGLVVRPMVTIVNSIPHFDQSAQNERTVGFGDTVLAFALPRSLLGGRLTVGAGPTFIFPTASKDCSARTHGSWGLMRAPPFSARTSSLRLRAAMVQGRGRRRDTNHMNGTFNFTYMLANGFTIGTQPNLSVDWEAPEDNRVAFSIGPQIGKLCRCGGTPTLFQVQVQYYPVRPNVAGPKWNIQLQATPTIPALIKKALF